MVHSFKAQSFEELDQQVRQWSAQSRQRIASISCYTDGTRHFAMVATTPAEPARVVLQDSSGSEVRVSEQGSLFVIKADY